MKSKDGSNMYPDTLWVMCALLGLINGIIFIFEEKHPKVSLVAALLAAVVCIGRVIQWKMSGVL